MPGKLQLKGTRPGTIFSVDGVPGITYMRTTEGTYDTTIAAVQLCGANAKSGTLERLNPSAEITLFDYDTILGLSNRYI